MTQPWYPFFWSDYSGKTMHLSQGEHGAYFLLMRWIYTTSKPIPHKQRYSIARALLEQEQSNVDSVLDQFFIRDGDLWRNERAEITIAQAEERHEKRVTAGRKGGKSNAKAKPQQSRSNAKATTPKPIPLSDNNKHLPKSPREADRDKSVDNSESGEEGFFQNGFGKGMGREGIPDPSVAKPIGAQFHHSSFDIRRFLTEKVIEAARKKAPGWDIYALAAIYNEGIEKRGIPDKPGGAFIAWCGKYTKGNPP